MFPLHQCAFFTFSSWAISCRARMVGCRRHLTTTRHASFITTSDYIHAGNRTLIDGLRTRYLTFRRHGYQKVPGGVEPPSMGSRPTVMTATLRDHYGNTRTRTVFSDERRIRNGNHYATLTPCSLVLCYEQESNLRLVIFSYPPFR